MSKYAMYRRRGSSPAGESTAPSLPPVLLTIVADSILDWSTWSGPDPDQWQIQQDGDNFDSVPGSDRQYIGTPAGHTWTVQGIDVVFAPVTEVSNTVSS